MKLPNQNPERKAFLVLLVYNVIVTGLMWLAYPKLPDRVVSHFNFHGEPDGTTEKTIAFTIFSAILILVPVLMPLLRRADPQQHNYKKFESTYIWFGWALSVFLQAIFGIMIGYYFVSDIPVQSLILTALGLLWMFLGNMLGRVRFNYFFGIRTPWTLANEQVWRSTHRLAGKVWFLSGLLACTGAWLMPVRWDGYIGLLAVATSVFVPMIYSYIVFRSNSQPR
ncbi:SdpI family protein [Paenibacillus alvei]|uniref:SdpI family protein n=1 Tax=Paenibacillus alvei TaxID=44250 RepID=UPI0018CE2D5C|nr:SdpI family protein [Paenibacillus alvei]MBG9734798.1 hypothetical protein [Paenibacillus alvei]MBG9744673.1 hypothetical protein [Paenibacillus alvei]MCY9578912.1 SdpI family protein [Paenibacillus alvei]MCY9583968.1 SdpI family protein [Paenibacillus alvei]